MKKISKKIIASALALAMTVAGSVVTFADEAASTVEMPVPSIESVIDGDTITVTVSASGDFVAGFDYGIAYDPAVVSVKDFNVDPTFAEFLANGQGINTSNLFRDTAYVVLGGVTTNQNKLGETVETTYNGVVGTVVFGVVEGADAKTAKFVAVTNSADAAKSLEEGSTLLKAAEEGKLPEGSTPSEVVTPAPVATEAPATTTAPADETEAPATTTAPADETKAPATTNAPAGVQPSAAAKTTAPAKTTAAAPAATTKTSPKTGDAGVVLPIVAICGAAAAVAVASKKKVED